MSRPLSSNHRYDAIVIGGGLAGVVATRDLSATGLSVLLLEARDYLGGRTHFREFADTNEMVEMGGAWVRPLPFISAEIRRYSIELGPGTRAQTQAAVLGGRRFEGVLPPPEQFEALERAVFHHLEAAKRIVRGIPFDLQPVADLDVAWRDFVGPLELPVETYEFLSTYVARMLGRLPAEASALHMLGWIVMSGGAWGLHAVYGSKFKNGTSELIAAIVNSSDAEVMLEAPVSRVRQSTEGVTVTTKLGDSFVARAAVVATPVNVWGDIEFSPALNDHKLTAWREGVGTPRTAKFWALVRDAPPVPNVIVAPETNAGVLYLSTDRLVGEDQLCYGHVLGPETDASTREGMERALEVFLPGSKLIKFDVHDWRTDTYSNGAAAGYKPGRLSTSHSHLSLPEGRLSFATADIAISSLASFDGAVEMGRRAAAQAADLLVGERAAATP